MRAERLKERLSGPRAVSVGARAPRWVIPVVKSALVVADLALAALSFFAAFYLREGSLVMQNGAGGNLMWSARFAPYAALLPFILPIRLLALYYLDLYRLRGEFSFVEDSVKVFKATAIGSLLIVAAAFLY